MHLFCFVWFDHSQLDHATVLVQVNNTVATITLVVLCRLHCFPVTVYMVLYGALKAHFIDLHFPCFRFYSFSVFIVIIFPFPICVPILSICMTFL